MTTAVKWFICLSVAVTALLGCDVMSNTVITVTLNSDRYAEASLEGKYIDAFEIVAKVAEKYKMNQRQCDNSNFKFCRSYQLHGVTVTAFIVPEEYRNLRVNLWQIGYGLNTRTICQELVRGLKDRFGQSAIQVTDDCAS